VLTHCPCGKHSISPDAADFFPRNARLVRTVCTDPIPKCRSTCQKPLDGCTHVCSSPCHEGPCPPCSIPLVRPCRCGSITRTIKCSQYNSDEDVLCDRPCTALRACRRHQCNRLCCPLAALSGGKGKGKKKGPLTMLEEDDSTGLHACDLLCGKTLSCGNHACEERDHRGACPPCLRSSFDEVCIWFPLLHPHSEPTLYSDALPLRKDCTHATRSMRHPTTMPAPLHSATSNMWPLTNPARLSRR
jgi:transcriptional repressor NF-X1